MSQNQLSRARPEHFTPSIADAFFFEELSATLSSSEAAHWLAQHFHAPGCPGAGQPYAASSSQNEPVSPVSRPYDAPLARDVAGESVHAEMSELALELGEDMGLLYTDAAHVILDSPPRSPRRAVDIEAGLGRKEKWASSLQVQDATGHHPHDGCEPLQREALNAAAGKSQPKLSSCWEAALEGDDNRELILDVRATFSSV
jgi:hypothetical protein